MSHKAASREAGFSLLEVLVAMTIMGLLGSIMASGVRFGLNAWAAGSDHLERLEDSRAVFGLLERQLSSASPRLIKTPDEDGYSQAVAAFWGAPDTVTFVGAPPAILRDQRPALMTYIVSPGGILDLQIKPFDSRNLVMDDAIRATILTGVTGIELRYFGRGDAQSIATWRNTWESQSRLPQLVEITLKRPNVDAASFTVAIRARSS